MSEPKKNTDTGLWEVDFRVNGKRSPRKQRTGSKGFTTKDAALAWMEELRVDHRRGVSQKSSSVVTFGFVCDRYYEEHALLHCRHPKKIYEHISLLKGILGANTPITDITEQGVVGVQKALQQRQGHRDRILVRNSTVNRHMTVLDTVMGRAKRWGYVQNNPCEYVTRLEEDTVLPRFLTIDELQRLFDASPTERCRDYMTLAYKTGIRPINLRTLRMVDVYLDQRVILIPKFKKKNSHYSVPIDDELFAWFQKKKHLKPSDLVLDLTNHDNEVEFAIEASGVNAGKTGDEIFTIYGLKHCFASHLLMNGASLYDVAKLLGHSDTQMVERHYGFLTKQHLANAASKARLPRLTPAPVPTLPAPVRQLTLSHEYSMN